jgi:hypothetical protein
VSSPSERGKTHRSRFFLVEGVLTRNATLNEEGIRYRSIRGLLPRAQILGEQVWSGGFKSFSGWLPCNTAAHDLADPDRSALA